MEPVLGDEGLPEERLSSAPESAQGIERTCCALGRSRTWDTRFGEPAVDPGIHSPRNPQVVRGLGTVYEVSPIRASVVGVCPPYPWRPEHEAAPFSRGAVSRNPGLPETSTGLQRWTSPRSHQCLRT